VTVTDDENPMIDCSNIDGNRTTDAGVCSFTMPGVGFDPASFSDNCPGATITNDYNNSTSLAGETFPLGDTDVTWTVTDLAGNSITCTFTVSVVDDEDPVLDCSNINPARDADPGVCSFTMPGTGFDPASFSDNCTGATIANDFNGLSSLAGETFPVGSTDVVWTVTDGSGNTASCT
ncbi:MAG: HYR domain-containing protein, partial [Bacteroidota bacterium]